MKIWLVLFSVLAIVAVAESSGTWTQVGSDIDGEAANDYFGTSVSMSADGTRVAIGAPDNDGNGTRAGHVRVYSESGGVWTQVGADIDGKASGDNFGHSVSMSSDGTRVVIGARYNDRTGSDAGHVRVYGLCTAATCIHSRPARGSDTTHTSIGGSIVYSALVVVGILLFCCWFFRRRRSSQRRTEIYQGASQHTTSVVSQPVHVQHSPGGSVEMRQYPPYNPFLYPPASYPQPDQRRPQ